MPAYRRFQEIQHLFKRKENQRQHFIFLYATVFKTMRWHLHYYVSYVHNSAGVEV